MTRLIKLEYRRLLEATTTISTHKSSFSFLLLCFNYFHMHFIFLRCFFAYFFYTFQFSFIFIFLFYICFRCRYVSDLAQFSTCATCHIFQKNASAVSKQSFLSEREQLSTNYFIQLLKACKKAVVSSRIGKSVPHRDGIRKLYYTALLQKILLRVDTSCKFNFTASAIYCIGRCRFRS